MTYRMSLAQVLQLAENEEPSLFTISASRYIFYSPVASDQSDFVINGTMMPPGGEYTVKTHRNCPVRISKDLSEPIFDVLGVQATSSEAGTAIVQIPISDTTGTSTLAISAPLTITAQIGQTTPIPGIGITDGADVSGVTFEVLVTAKDGGPAAGGNATGSGTASLDIVGSLSDVNAALATVTVTEASAGFDDTITVGVGDSAEDVTAPRTIDVAVSGQLSITGTGGNEATSDTSGVVLFPAARVTEPFTGTTDTVTITLSNPANGTLTDAVGGCTTP